MAYLKYLLPALAAGRVALAGSDPCKPSDTFKIESAGDAGKISSCKTFSGDIEVSEKFSGNLNLGGVQHIDGQLTAESAGIKEFTAASLSSIKKSFTLHNLTTLANLDFGALNKVGSIDWEALPKLQTLSFGKGVSEADVVSISNTGLSSLDGISLEKVRNFEIQNNPALKSVNVNELKKTTGLINFSGNNQSLNIKLPNLDHGNNMTFTNVSSVYVPSLHFLSGKLGLYGDSFLNFSAPNLTSAGDVAFNGNKELNNISLPLLKTVDGAFQIARNDKLKDIGFPSLQNVTGAIDWSGKFDNVTTPKLQTVSGGFNMQSTGDFSCGPYDKLKGKEIKGKYYCKGAKPNPTTKDGSSGTTSGGGSTSGSSSANHKNAAVGNVANIPGMAIAAFFGALLQYAL